MGGETEEQVSGWTVDTLRVHMDAIWRADEKLQAAHEKFEAERDRRYSEVSMEKEKALHIKDVEAGKALDLAREIQVYKDEKANQLREQIDRERVTYASKDDLLAAVSKIDVKLDPVIAWVTAQQGRREGIGVSTGVLVGAITVLATVMGIIVVVANLLTAGPK